MPIRIRLTNTPRDSAGRVAVFNSTTGLLEASVVTTAELEILSGLDGGDILTEDNVKTVSGKTFNQDLVADADNEHDLGASGARWKDAYVAGDVNAGTLSTTGDVVVGGNLVVQGTTTTVNSDTLEVADANVTVNKGGLDATAEGAGLTVERPAGNGSLIYAAASATKFRAGTEGAEVDLVGTTSSQTFTNKTIVVASNTITTAAAGNLASTELNAALAELQGDIDTRATQTDLQDHLNDTTGAHAASAISNNPSGNLGATTVQAALNELQGDINGLDTRVTTAEGEIDQAQADILTNAGDIADVAQDLSNHLADDTGAHAASAISSSPAGNLAASNVQAALEELQADLDTRALDADLDAHTGAAAGAHAASAISNTPSGNVAATTVQAAINELQTDIDTRALDSDLDTHTAATSAHGVSGAIVGTSDAQVLTNKDIDGGTAANTRRITLPKDTKANLDALARKAGTLVYASDLLKAYIDNGSNLVPVGSGAGGGINLLTLDSSWQPNNNDNYDFETSIGSWIAYADAAATAPVDMTGGSPGTALSRITSSQLNGAASARANLGSGSSRQGEGWSCVAYVPTAYRDRTLTLKFAYSITGAVVEDDLVPYVYDITNSALIKPFVKSKLLGSTGICVATFPVGAATAQIRVGVHVARTSTGALSVSFDDVQVTPETSPFGLAGSNPEVFQMVIEGTTSNPTKASSPVTDLAVAWREGPELVVSYNYKHLSNTGAADGSGVYLFKLPFNLRMDSRFVQFGTTGSTSEVGRGQNMIVSGSEITRPVSVQAYDATHVALYLSQTGPLWIGSAEAPLTRGVNAFNFQYRVPIDGWSANVSMAESSTFWISSFLANGTRLTSGTPSKLGEYRAYVKNSSAVTGADTAPTTAPSAANGMIIYAVPYSTGGTSGQPGRYEIFIGRNKNFKIKGYSGSGRSGSMDMTFFGNGVDFWGVTLSYDETTGVLVVDGFDMDTATSGRFVGRSSPTGGGSRNNYTSGYFDIQVSENALAVGVQIPRSEVVLNTANGYGSTNNKIKRFSTLEYITGTAITYADSSTDGASFTINEDGVYAITYIDDASEATRHGISLNSNQLTTDIGSISQTARLGTAVVAGSGFEACCSVTRAFRAGEVIRPHTAGVGNSVASRTKFIIAKVSH